MYSGPVTVSSTETIEAIATVSGYAQSAVGSATYTIAAPTPTLSPAAGTYAFGDPSVNVTLADSDPSATIYYTLTVGTTGTTPTTSSSVYSGPIQVNSTDTVEAMATAPGVANSAVASGVYQVEFYPPTMSLAAGTYVGSQTVTLSDSASNSATIYYTTNGTTPTTSSTRYRSAITVSSSETLQAIATYSGYATSPVASAAYTITSTVPTPTVAPAGGTYSSAQVVSIGDSALNATIYYTITSGTAGVAPTTSSPVYTGAATVGSTKTIEAIADVTGYSPSSAVAATYTIPAQTTSATTLSITSGGNSVTSVNGGTTVTLTAAVDSNAAPVTTGVVKFCDASATYCTDIHLVGSAQLTSSGTAAISFRPGGGAHSYKAEFAGTPTSAASSSTVAQLQVIAPTTTAIGATGTPDGYTLTATVSESGSDLTSPTGSVSFEDGTNGNAVVGTASLAGQTFSQAFTKSTTLPLTQIGQYTPQMLATGDFNGDGKADLVVQSEDNLSIYIELGNGDGTFTSAPGSPIVLPCGYAGAIAVADFNNDGKQDLAIQTACGVMVLLGNGDGTFTLTQQSPIPLNTANGIAVGDFNHDGNQDIAVIQYLESSNVVTVLLGNGDGTFTQAGGAAMTVGEEPDYIVAGDFTGDGTLDLAVGDAWQSTLTVYLGNGDGTFAEASGSPISLPEDVTALAVGDFNGDGKTDIALSLYDEAEILLSNGDGTFTQPSGSPYSLDGSGAGGITVGDFNADGIPDIAVGAEIDTDNNEVVVLTGNGNGTFARSYFWSGPAESLAAADFNGDGTSDLAVAEFYPIVNAPSDVATYLNMLTTAATASASGVAVVGAGTHNVLASYGGDGNYSASTSSTTPLTGVVDIVSGISPASGSAGTSVAISGAGFGSAQEGSTVTVGGVAAVATSWSDTTIEAMIPNGPGPGPQSVLVIVGGQSGPGAAFTVTPSVATITPSSGVSGGFVQIAGTNFGSQTSASSVTFNGVQGQIYHWTPSGIVITIPSGVSTGPLVVTACNPGGTWCGSSNGVTFTAITGPTITGLSPVAAPVGTTVTVSGLNFGTSGALTFNGIQANPTSWGIDAIVTPVPAGATTGPVIVTSGGASSNAYTFTVTGGITGISPAQGTAGTAVTVTGSGFGSSQGSSVVSFGGVPATASTWTNTSIVVEAPVGAITGSVSVEVAGQTTTGPVFTYWPQITSVSPSSAPTGTVITISGSNFGGMEGTSSVYFGQIVGLPSNWSEDTVVVPVPLNAITAPITLVVDGMTSNAVPFTVGAATSTGTVSGTITESDGVTPISGATVTALNGNVPGGSANTTATGTYSISDLGAGTYSVEASAYGFGAAMQSGISVVSGQTSVANLSLSSQSSVSYSYDADGRLVGVATSQGTAAYSYDPVGNILSIGRSGVGQTAILDFSPNEGPVGTSVAISGVNFGANPQQDTVTFGGIAANISSASAIQLLVTVPTGAVTGPISVTAPDGAATSSTAFTVSGASDAPAISSFTPTLASPGSSVTITGSNFDVLANDLVSFNGASSQLTAANATTIVATVPPTATSGPISLMTPAGNASSNNSMFVVPSGYTTGQVDFAGQLTIGGSPYSGTIENPGDIGLVVFSATAGQPISLSIADSTVTSANISIIAPEGATLESETVGTGSSLLDSIPAPVSGAYSVIVTGTSAEYTGALTLSLNQGTGQSNTSGNSTTAQINIDTAGQTATIPFNGTAGQTVSVEIENSTFTGGLDQVSVSILNPDGSTLATGMASYDANYLLGPSTLSSTGTYTVVIAPTGSNTGSATLLVSLFQNQTMTVTPVSGGTSTTMVSIPTPGQEALLSFNGTAGQMISLELANSNFTGGFDQVSISILNPGGSTLASGSASYNANYLLGPSALPSTGTYTIVIAPTATNTGSTTLLLSLFQNQTTTITPDSGGTTVPVSISIPGQEAILSFSGTAGQSVTAEIENSTFTGGFDQVSMAILNPDGSTLTSGQESYNGNFTLGPSTLPTTGTYTIVIAPTGTNTGGANVLVTLQ